MQKKLNSFINSSICVSIIFIVLGIIMVIFPKTSLTVLSISLSILLILNGIYLIIIDVKLNDRFIPIDMLPTGILSILLGAIMLLYPNTLSIIIPIVLGTWVIITSILKLRLVISLRNFKNTPWILILIISILSIICGFILILNPTITSITLTLFIGIMIIVYAISDIIDMIVLKKQVKNLAKYFKENIKIIEE